MSTDENDIVLDPFNGTGTTAIAAKRLGRQFIGFDLTVHYGLNGNGHGLKRKAAHNSGLAKAGVTAVKKRKHSK